MPDIKALTLLAEECSSVRGLAKPPGDYSAADAYRRKVDKAYDKATNTGKQVGNYARDITSGLDELREALKQHGKHVQDGMQKVLDNIKPGNGRHPTQALRFIQELQKMEVKRQRLEEFIVQTQIVVDKIEENIGCTFDDIDLLKGYLNSWKHEKDENYEQEKARLDKERREREEADRQKREEAERKRKEEEERRRKEEEERKRREQEEAERQRMEEERMREEEERLRREEEERLKREEDERKKREEEERKRRAEEEKRNRLEAEAKRKELDRQRTEAERIERERLEREAEARRIRLDPNNWDPHIYDRNDGDVDGRRAHHKGVCCVLTSPPNSVEKDDLECLASDEDTDIIEILEDGERIASSVIDVESKKGLVTMEAPARVYIPHCHVADPGDEIAIKVTQNGIDWVTKTPLMPTAKTVGAEGVRLLGVELDSIDKARIVVIARRKNQTFSFDKGSSHQYSTYDKNIKLFVPRDTFRGPTEVKLAVRPITTDALSSLAREKECCEHIIATSSLLTLSCERFPEKNIEIDLLKNKDPSGVKAKGKAYQLYRTKDNLWKFADAEYKGKNQDVSVSLPAGKDKFNMIEVELLQTVPKEDALRAAEMIYEHAQKSVVRLLLKQNQDNPSLAIVQCTRREAIHQRLTELEGLGYTTGADSSREFCLKDGQKLHFSFSGNIAPMDGGSKTFTLPFYTYMDSAKREITVHVKDKFKQRDMPEYIGNLICTVESADARHADTEFNLEMPLTLPKTEHVRTRVKSARIAFPHYLSALTGFLSWELTERKEPDWFTVLARLDSRQRVLALHRHAKSKCDENDDRAVCKAVLSDWMKARPRQDNKMEPICRALRECGLYDLSNECYTFVDYHKNELSMSALWKIAEQCPGSVGEIGTKLGLSPQQIKRCSDEDSDAENVVALLQLWRETDNAIKRGTTAVAYLKQVLNI